MYNENRYYYQRNILGDITHIYSEDGVLVAKYVYDGYGRGSGGFNQYYKFNNIWEWLRSVV